MKVLHVLASNSFSGAENVVCQIISMFESDAEVEMAYCCPEGKIREALAERGIKFLPISKLVVKELKYIINSYKPDVIHAHDMRATFVVSRSCRNIPFVSHIHGNFAALNKFTIKSLAFSWATRKAKHIFWVSRSSFDEYIFKSYVKKKSSELRNVIDVDALYDKMNRDENTYFYDIVYLGRLTWEKNPERLIRVLRLVVDKMGEVRIAIIGTGDLEAKTKQLAKQLGVDKNIDFLGFVSNPLKILHDAKVMIMTSIREGTPICALEALALGTPIVSTPTDGLIELVEDCVDGFLNNEDDILSSRLAEVIKEKDLCLRLSQNAIEKSKTVNDKYAYCDKISEQYTRLVRK